MRRLTAAVFVLVGPALFGDTLVMKSGEKYEIKGPAKHSNGRVTFTTTANRLYSVKESEVASETGPPPPVSKGINRADSRQLGAYAREQNEQKGKVAPVTGKSTTAAGDAKKKKKEPEKSPPPPPPSAQGNL